MRGAIIALGIGLFMVELAYISYGFMRNKAAAEQAWEVRRNKDMFEAIDLAIRYDDLRTKLATLTADTEEALATQWRMKETLAKLNSELEPDFPEVTYEVEKDSCRGVSVEVDCPLLKPRF